MMAFFSSLLGRLVAVVAGLLAVYGIGKSRGRSDAKTDQAEHEAKAIKAVAEELAKDRSADDIVSEWEKGK